MPIPKLNFSTGNVVDPTKGALQGVTAARNTLTNSMNQWAKEEELARKDKFRRDQLAATEDRFARQQAQSKELANLPYEKKKEYAQIASSALQKADSTNPYADAVNASYAGLTSAMTPEVYNALAPAEQQVYDTNLTKLNEKAAGQYDKYGQDVYALSQDQAKQKRGEVQQSLLAQGVPISEQKSILDQYAAGLNVVTPPSKEALNALHKDKKLRLDELARSDKNILEQDSGYRSKSKNSKDSSSKYGSESKIFDVVKELDLNGITGYDTEDASMLAQKAMSGQSFTVPIEGKETPIAIPPSMVEAALKASTQRGALTDDRVPAEKFKAYITEAMSTNASNRKLVEGYNRLRSTGYDSSTSGIGAKSIEALNANQKRRNEILGISMPAPQKTGADLWNEELKAKIAPKIKAPEKKEETKKETKKIVLPPVEEKQEAVSKISGLIPPTRPNYSDYSRTLEGRKEYADKSKEYMLKQSEYNTQAQVQAKAEAKVKAKEDAIKQANEDMSKLAKEYKDGDIYLDEYRRRKRELDKLLRTNQSK